MVPVLDDASLPHGHGRVLQDGLVNQFIDVLERVHFPRQFFQQFTGKSAQDLFNMGKHFQGAFKCNQVPWIGCLVTDAPDKPLQVINGIQVFTDFLPGNIIHVQFFHGCLTLYDFLLMDQGLLNVGAQQTGSHGCLGLVKHP